MGRRTAAVLALCVATAAAFWPALSAGFVNWDDGANFVENFAFRGLGWDQLRWMWTTFHMGHYQPLSWMTLGLDYLVWGMDPRGYHLTNVVLHGLGAVLFFLVAERLLARATGRVSTLGALVAALFFAVHPLRVESVAWITERRDVLSGVFYLAALLFYLRREDDPKVGLRPALIFFVLSLLSKGIGVTLPLVLLVLDAYPLGRWKKAGPAAVLREKIPFFVLSLVFGVAAVLAQRHTGVLARMASVGPLARVELSLFGAAFYLWKTAWSFGLIPLYGRPEAALWIRDVVAGAVVVLVVSTAAIGLRRRVPALLAAWVCYLVTALPVLGVVLSGVYAAADRYTYLACLPWTLLSGAAAEAGRRRARLRPGVLAGLCAAVAGSIALSRRQAEVWHDSISLWRHELSAEPRNAIAHNNLGTALARQGRETDAADEFSRAIDLDPRYAEARNNLATNRARAGDLDGAVREYREALAAEPDYAMARDNLGAVLAGQGRLDEAMEEYRRALAFDPDDAHAHNNLGEAFLARGRKDDAAAEFRRALTLSPHYARAETNLRSCLASTPGLQ